LKIGERAHGRARDARIAGVAWGVYALRDEMKEVTQAVPEATRRAGEWLGLEQSARQAEDAARSPAVVQQGVGWLLSAAGHLTVVVFLVYFLLISGEHFRQRFIEVAGRHLERRRITIDVLDDINRQIQRYTPRVPSKHDGDIRARRLGVATYAADSLTSA